MQIDAGTPAFWRDAKPTILVLKLHVGKLYWRSEILSLTRDLGRSRPNWSERGPRRPPAEYANVGKTMKIIGSTSALALRAREKAGRLPGLSNIADLLDYGTVTVNSCDAVLSPVVVMSSRTL